MKHLAKLSFILMVLVIAFSGCKKKVMLVNEDYEGSWEDTNGGLVEYFITIESSSKGSYSANRLLGGRLNPFRNDNASGTVRLQDNTLKIGGKGLTVTQHPEEDEFEVWTMTLEGVNYTRTSD